MSENRLCNLLAIRCPILMGGMLWVGTAKLAAAVSNAGGLGVIAASNVPIKDLEQKIQVFQSLSRHPFGVNVPIINPLSAEHFDFLCKSKKVPIVITSAGSPQHHTQRLKDAGIKVLHVVSNVEEGRKAEDAGVEAIIAEGAEAGGHNGKDEMATMVLIPQIVDAVRAPVVAAGGICEVRGFLAALVLGAEGVQMGTRFISAKDCEAHINYKAALVSAKDTDTVLVGRNTGLRRLLKTPYAQKVREEEIRGASMEEMKSLLDRNRSKLGFQGDLENGIFFAGQGVGLIKDILPVDEIIIGMITQCQAHLLKLQRKLSF
jgi:enoyl-[acyl-carrier protein] reductase II